MKLKDLIKLLPEDGCVIVNEITYEHYGMSVRLTRDEIVIDYPFSSERHSTGEVEDVEGILKKAGFEDYTINQLVILTALEVLKGRKAYCRVNEEGKGITADEMTTAYEAVLGVIERAVRGKPFVAEIYPEPEAEPALEPEEEEDPSP